MSGVDSMPVRLETWEELEMLQAFRRLTPKMRRALLRMQQEICSGVCVREAGVSFWTIGGLSRATAEAAVTEVLVGAAAVAGTGSA